MWPPSQIVKGSTLLVTAGISTMVQHHADMDLTGSHRFDMADPGAKIFRIIRHGIIRDTAKVAERSEY